LIPITVIMLLAVASAIKPFNIGKIPINMVTVPLLGLLLLFFFGIIDGETINSGIMGNGDLRPWEIIVIFFTVAYISISLDTTGILDFFAYQIIRKSIGNGVSLFISIYLFSCFLTVFTSNDIVILTLTPIIFYLGKHAKINVTPLLFAQFYGANTMSMFLYIGNPTNIIVGNALGLGFLEYTKVMWIPSLTACTLNMALLFYFFKKEIPAKFEMNPSSQFSVKNWADAIISTFMLIVMLIVLFFSHDMNVPIWVVTSVTALFFVLGDIFFGIYYTSKIKHLPSTAIMKEKREISELYGIPEERNDFWITLKRVPWKILPFILVFFILVAALGKYGAIDIIGEKMSLLSGTLAGSIFFNGAAGFLLANIINNQPMTILFSNVLTSGSFQTSAISFTGAAYSIVAASNLGANLTLTGALAGLMWSRILQTKGINISYVDFAKTGIRITPFVFLMTLLSLYLVLILK